MEDKLIKLIKGGIFGMKNGSKTPQDVTPHLNRLKAINLPMYEELFNNYKAAKAEYDLKHTK